MQPRPEFLFKIISKGFNRQIPASFPLVEILLFIWREAASLYEFTQPLRHVKDIMQGHFLINTSHLKPYSYVQTNFYH